MWAPSARLGVCQVLRDEIPVDQMIEERLHEIWASVLVIEVIGMLPDVAGQQRGLAERQRVDTVQGVGDLELPFLDHQPGPAAAELLDGRLLELFLEFMRSAEIALDRLREVALWRAAA